MSEEKIKKGRKMKLTPYQRAISERSKKDRMRIANMVKRKPEIEKHCCICGKEEAEILHNKRNPYMITFICRECRADEDKLKQAEKHRFDIREIMDKSTLSTKNFTGDDVKKIIENYLFEISSIGAYCDKVGISRHQFNQLTARYESIYNDPAIKKKIINHANKVNRENLSKLAYERNNF